MACCCLETGCGVEGSAFSARDRTVSSCDARQEQQVFRWINGKDPRQYGLDFGLWTRSIVDSLIEQKFNVRLGLTAIGALLASDIAPDIRPSAHSGIRL
jgi:transposase